jgi:DNA repair protein RecN (Recombination protein N)
LFAYNCIIGETGSGKSLVADAIQIILGARVEKNFIRRDTSFCVLEAELTCHDDSVLNYLNEKGFPCENNSVFIKRIVNLEGPNKSYINGSYCSSQILKEFSKRYIDLVGQFHNQKLLSSTYQLKLIDHFVPEKSLISYKSDFENLQKLIEKREALEEDFNQSSDQEDFLKFQAKELEKVQSLLTDEKNLLKEKESFLQAQKELKVNTEIADILSEDSNGGIESSLNKLKHLIGNEEALKAKYYSAIEQFVSTVNDLSFDINNTESEFDEARLSEVLDGLDKIQKLKRKHDCDADGLIDKLKNIQQKLTIIDSYNSNREKLNKQIELQTHVCDDLAIKLHKQRIKSAEEISSKLNKMVSELNMKGCKIQINLNLTDELGPSGRSKLKFLIETNPGEGFHELQKIASGGELSRILLCLRRVIASKDSISVFFFDEIDTGIGGETAKKIGLALSSIAQTGQVIAITHLPQIAQFTNLLIDVQKTHLEDEKNMRTVSSIQTFTSKDLGEKVKNMISLDI